MLSFFVLWLKTNWGKPITVFEMDNLHLCGFIAKQLVDKVK